MTFSVRRRRLRCVLWQKPWTCGLVQGCLPQKAQKRAKARHGKPQKPSAAFIPYQRPPKAASVCSVAEPGRGGWCRGFCHRKRRSGPKPDTESHRSLRLRSFLISVRRRRLQCVQWLSLGAGGWRRDVCRRKHRSGQKPDTESHRSLRPRAFLSVSAGGGFSVFSGCGLAQGLLPQKALKRAKARHGKPQKGVRECVK